MGVADKQDGGDGSRITQLTLKIRHPDCWTLETTAAVDAGLLAHSVHEVDGAIPGHGIIPPAEFV